MSSKRCASIKNKPTLCKSRMEEPHLRRAKRHLPVEIYFDWQWKFTSKKSLKTQIWGTLWLRIIAHTQYRVLWMTIIENQLPEYQAIANGICFRDVENGIPAFLTFLFLLF